MNAAQALASGGAFVGMTASAIVDAVMRLSERRQDMEVAQQRETVTTESLYSAMLAERAKEQKFPAKQLRLSEIGLCERKQTLRALGFEPEEADERSLSIFESGDEHEEFIVSLWAQRFPRRIRRQILVPTPYGAVGHADLWIPPIRRIVEAKSTTEKQLGRLPMEHHVWQLQAYLGFWGRERGATGELCYRTKEDGRIYSFPVEFNEKTFGLIVRKLTDIQAAIELFREPLPIPEGYGPTHFPCAWPTPQGMARCPFWQHCWGEGASAQAGEKSKIIVTVPLLTNEVEEYVNLDAQRKASTKLAEDLKARQAEIEGIFDKALDDAGAQALSASGITISRSKIPGRVTPDIEGAIAAGVFTAQEIEPCLTQGAGFNRWFIKSHKEGK